MKAARAHRQRAIKKAATKKTARPPQLNCTKVVRLFVVTPERTIDDIRATESTTRTDVFVVRVKGGIGSARGISKSGDVLIPRSIGSSAVVDHDLAHRQHPGSVVVLKTGEQIEWQCDVPFRVVNITMAKDAHHASFRKVGRPPKEPFRKGTKELRKMAGDSCTPIRSGPTRSTGSAWKQLYKVHFELLIDKEWKAFDPDVYGTCGN